MKRKNETVADVIERLEIAVRREVAADLAENSGAMLVADSKTKKLLVSWVWDIHEHAEPLENLVRNFCADEWENAEMEMAICSIEKALAALRHEYAANENRKS